MANSFPVEEKVSHQLVENRLKKIADPEEQMSTLVEILTLTDQDIKNRMDIAEKIRHVLSEHYPKNVVHLFGSTVNGLGFKGCDIDAYVEVGEVEVIGRNHVLEEAKISKLLPKEKMMQVFEKILESLSHYQSYRIDNVTAIRNARVPIIKFLICGQAVDLSIKSNIGVMNSKLIQLFIEYNPSIKPFMVLIRYWASFYGLCGSGNRQTKITNYALTMLMIFYLQMHEELPSVKSLQENLKKENSVIIDNLQCGYPKTILEWPQYRIV